MSFQKVFATVNQMQAAGVIGEYALGGAVGAAFYLEPFATVDVDVFVNFSQQQGPLINLQPIYEFLTSLGGEARGEHLVIGGWPVQFLPAPGPLVEEAIREARETVVEGETVRIMPAEYLAAIALETGRPKDKVRLLQFMEAGVLDQKKFEALVDRFYLMPKWRAFKQQFIRGDG